MRMQRSALGLVLAVLASPVTLATSALANNSVYTDLDLNRCKTVTADEMGAVLTCGGYRSYQVHFSEGDLRQSVFYGPVRKDVLEQAFESFEPFNRVFNRIEWRVDGTGRPYAAILRWFIENLARAVADNYAANFICMQQEALWHGRRGDKAAEPTHVWPEPDAEQP
jgi:hypothetical protein